MNGVRRYGRLAPLGALIWLAATAQASPPGDVKALANDLKKAVAGQNSEQIQRALEAMLAHGGPDACEQVLTVIPKLGRAGDDTYWQLVSAGAGFREAPALTYVGEFILKNKSAPFARDLLFALENNPSPNTPSALGQILEKGPYDLQLMAADQLARVRTVAAVDVLINHLKKEGDKGDPELKRRILTSLQAITGESMGDTLNWTGWWDVQRANGLPDRTPQAGDSAAGAQHASQTLDPNRKREFESLQRNPNRILVISSRLPADDPKEPNGDYNYDHMESVLQQMEIAHTVVLKKDFEKDTDKYLRDAWTILVNCNNIQTQCICTDCRRILAQKVQAGNAGGVKNRLYTCPPECSKHDQVSYRMSQQTIDRLKAWVEAGGSLFTEDWGIVEIVQPAWGNLLENGRTTPGQNGGPAGTEYNLVTAMDVKITPGRGLTSLPLLRGVFARPRPPAEAGDAQPSGDGTQTRGGDAPSPAAPPQHQWKIDNESPAIQIKDRAAVTVLMESADLGAAAGGNEAVAVTFRAGNGSPRRQGAASEPRRGPMTGGGGNDDAGQSRGRGEWSEELRGGRVLHVISHFGKQQGRKEDTFVLQNLILNFIMESNRQHMN
jgi:hypothetical protein